MKKYFIPFACCIPVKGFKRSIICDLQRNSFKFIPNDLYSILLKTRTTPIEEIISEYDFVDHETINDYFEFLIDNEFGFWTDSPEKFPPMALTYDSPGLINNSIIDFDHQSNHPVEEIITELEYLGCKDVQLRFFDTYSVDKLDSILRLFEGTRIKSIDVYIKYPNEHLEELLSITELCNRINTLVIHSGPESKVISQGFQNMGKVLMTTQIIDSESHCGIISPIHFSINLEAFTEAVNHNSCLNKKISIDKNGEIRNCPSMLNSYGNIAHMSLTSTLENPDFHDIFNVTKDNVLECKDCEFRYICTDCRAYLKDTTDKLSKPAKCTYNPYEGVWN